MKWCLIIIFPLIYSGQAVGSDDINDFLFKIDPYFEFLDLTYTYDDKREFR